MPISKTRPIFALIFLILTTSLACNLGGLTPKSEPTPTIPPTAEISIATDLPPVALTPTAEPLPSATPTVMEEELLSQSYGFVVKRDNSFIPLDFEGNSIGEEIDAPDSDEISEFNSSVFNEGLIYTRYEDGGVTLLTHSERRLLDFISSSDPISAKINPDASMIAWAYQIWTEDPSALASEVWVANMDGSNMRKAAEITADENIDRWWVFHVYGWTVDGRVLIVTQPTGIGGYILYGGWNGIRVYDPLSGETQVLVADDERLTLSLNSVSDDLTKAAISQAGMHIRTLATGVELVLPLVGDQSVCGSARFSPSGEWIAYACGRNNPDDEAGQVMVARVDGSLAPLIIHDDQENAPRVLGWIDDDSLLFQTFTRSDYSPTIWRVNRDGSLLTLLSEESFIGFIPE